MEILQFVPFKSFVNQNFWFKFADIKIDIDRLSDSPRKIFGWYSNHGLNMGTMEIDCTSFNENFHPSKHCFTSHGTLLNKNTIEEFKSCDKSSLSKEYGLKIIENIENGAVLSDPTLLSNFFILSFADLKLHKFYYWFCFPSPINPIVNLKSKPKTIKEFFNENNFIDLNRIYFDEEIEMKNKSFFIIEEDNDGKLNHKTLKEKIVHNEIEKNFVNDNLNKIYFCFSDPSEYENPAWNLRLYIFFLCKLCPKLHGKTIKILAIRCKSLNSIEKSLIFNIELPNVFDNDLQKFIGWEVNQSNKLIPQLADMRSTMDPKCLAENSVNLNLKLMKWRLLPDLDLQSISQKKCLLFGAGTLGCAVSRILMGWGVYNLTFVDAGHVSYSNPVRQNLYTHDDAVAGKRKVDAACERIISIHPGANVNGHYMVVPMPGHPVGESTYKTTIETLKKINDLIESHDVLFLLTDSRESRWLPTMLGAFHNKIVINAALGFDSYVVMRHGSRNIDLKNTQNYIKINGLKCISGNSLGCYFCNDITAPGDSMKDRTLDQQCTVTRPAVSNIASALAVELMISLLQHPNKQNAPAYIAERGNAEMNSLIPEGILGIIPHSIRGMLCNFEQIIPGTEKFSQCIACSHKILEQYKSRGNDFIIDVLNSKKYLEDVTGITDMESNAFDVIALDGDMDFDISESD